MREEVVRAIKANQYSLRVLLKALAAIDGVKCPNYLTRNQEDPKPCVLDEGHAGLHQDENGAKWGDISRGKAVVIRGIEFDKFVEDTSK